MNAAPHPVDPNTTATPAQAEFDDLLANLPRINFCEYVLLQRTWNTDPHEYGAMLKRHLGKPLSSADTDSRDTWWVTLTEQHYDAPHARVPRWVTCRYFDRVGVHPFTWAIERESALARLERPGVVRGS